MVGQFVHLDHVGDDEHGAQEDKAAGDGQQLV